MVNSVALILLDKLVRRPVVPNQVGVAERVPHLRRSHGTPGQAGQAGYPPFDTPVLPGSAAQFGGPTLGA
jgi:hypothetical protein